MATTFEKYAGQSARNYSSLPTIDVEILEPDHSKCKCGEPIHLDRSIPYMTQWRHEDPALDQQHSATPPLECDYCGSQDPALVKFSQPAWHDEVSCKRCGGSTGWAIGD